MLGMLFFAQLGLIFSCLKLGALLGHRFLVCVINACALCDENGGLLRVGDSELWPEAREKLRVGLDIVHVKFWSMQRQTVAVVQKCDEYHENRALHHWEKLLPRG